MPLPAAGTMKTNSQMLLLIHIRPSRYGFSSVPAQTRETLLRHRSFLHSHPLPPLPTPPPPPSHKVQIKTLGYAFTLAPDRIQIVLQKTYSNVNSVSIRWHHPLSKSKYTYVPRSYSPLRCLSRLLMTLEPCLVLFMVPPACLFHGCSEILLVRTLLEIKDEKQRVDIELGVQVRSLNHRSRFLRKHRGCVERVFDSGNAGGLSGENR